MLESIQIDCPYCGEIFETLADASAGDQRYIEDCQVCCRPIEFVMSVDASGRLVSIEALRDDE